MDDRDRELRIITDCARGDWREFEHIFNKYKQKVYFLALGMLKDEVLARDVTQTCFIRVFRSLKWFDRRSSFSTWIYRIAYNQALDQYRKRKKRESVESGGEGEAYAVSSPGRTGFEEAAGKEKREKVRAAIDALPVKLRTVVILRYIEDLTYSEICSIVGCARGVLQRRLARASKMLKEMLGDELSGSMH